MSEAKRDLLLLKLWNSGNTSAGETLFNENYEKLLKHVSIILPKYFTNRQNTAEEIVQEVFMRAIRKKDEYNGSALFITWLKGFVQNCIKEQIKSLKKDHKLEFFEDNINYTDDIISELPEFGDPEFILLLKENKELLIGILTSLKDDYQEIIKLRLIEGIKNKDVALHMSKNEKTTESLYFRALKELRKRFKEKY